MPYDFETGGEDKLTSGSDTWGIFEKNYDQL